MKKRILCLALALVLALGALPFGLLRAAAETYPVWVGGIQVTTENQENIPVAGGTARYNPGTCTLTLEQVSGVSGLHTVSGKACMICAVGVDLTVQGSASLSDPNAGYGICVPDGSLTVRGTLELDCGESAVRCGELLLSGCAIVSPGDARIYAGQIYRGDGTPSPSVRFAPTLPAITVQPADVTALLGTAAAFRVAASGIDLRYQWEYSKDQGASWLPWPGKTEPAMTVTASATNNGCLYRCTVSNSAGSTASAAARLTVPDVVAPTVLTQPEDVTAALGTRLTFRVKASGAGLSYQWFYSKDNGASWLPWSGNTAPTLTVTASVTNNGCLYRCEISNSAGSCRSASARLEVPDARPNILVQPAAASVTEGGTAVFRVVCAGTEPRYQWQSSTDAGKTWKSLSGQTAAALPLIGSSENNKTLYRCIVSNVYGSVVSAAAKLTVVFPPEKPTVTEQPVSTSAKLGEVVSFRVAAKGTGLSYQWYYSKNGGAEWTLWSGKTDSFLRVVASATNNGCLYRCAVSNSGGTAVSEAAALTVTNAGLTVLAQPEDASAAVGGSVSFAVSVRGTGLKYQWYYSKNDGASWTLWSGKTAASLPVKASTTNNGCLYRCMVTGSEGYAVTRSARLTATNSWPAILTQPQSVSASLGQAVTFRVTAWGAGLHYQWYYSKDGGANWSAWSGKTEAVLKVTASSTNAGCLYRCYMYNAYGVATSEKAKLTVTP